MDDENVSKKSAPRRGFLTWLVWLGILVALGLAGLSFWHNDQVQRSVTVTATTQNELQTQLLALQGTLTDLRQSRTELQQQMSDLLTANRSRRALADSLKARLGNLEAAVTGLAEQQHASNGENLNLDTTAFLLRMAQARMRLFHDTVGAVDVLNLAAQAMNAAHDPTYAPVLQAINTERSALQQLQTSQRAAALQQLGRLRSQVWSLPLRSNKPEKLAGSGAWSRLRTALSVLVTIRHDTQTRLDTAPPQLLHGLLALDLAQAQAALLGYQRTGYAQGLLSSRRLLSAQFNLDNPQVQAFATRLRSLQGWPVTVQPRLGTALKTLRRLRALQTLVTPPAPVKKESSP